MRRGGGKQKGAAFERAVCQRLSLWVSRNQVQDLFWRSAMSGGRATIGRKKGVGLNRQAGDICAVAPEGHILTDQFYVETKFYMDLGIGRFLIGSGLLYNFWIETCIQANHYGRAPMLIAKQNNYPTLLLTAPRALERFVGVYDANIIRVRRDGRICEIREFDDVMSRRFRRERVKE